jgi:transposase
MRPLDLRIAATAAEITTGVTPGGSTLDPAAWHWRPVRRQDLAHVGDISRFHSAAAFASYIGTASIEVSPVTWGATGSPGPDTVNSTAPCTSWPSPKSHNNPGRSYQRKRAAEKATEKPCDA